MGKEPWIIKEESESVDTRFISFKQSDYRFDLAILTAERFNGQKMIIDLNSNKMAILNREKIEKEGILEHEFQFNEIKAAVLRNFLLNYV